MKLQTIAFKIAALICRLRGHRYERVNNYFRDSESKSAREARALFVACFGTSNVCMRCGMPEIKEDHG